MFDLSVINNISLEEINESINKFKNFNLDEMSPISIQKYATFFSQFFEPRTFIISKTEKIYRARVNDGKFFSHISQLWYPPLEIAPLERCSYASTNVLWRI